MKKTLIVVLSLFSMSFWAHAQFTISGTVTHDGSGLAGVVLQGLPGPPVTDASGRYSVLIEYPSLTERVIPTLSGYGFDPRYTEYIDVSSDTVTDYEAYDAGFRLDSYPIPPEYDLGGLLLNAIPIDFDHDGSLDIVATQFSPHDEIPFPSLAYVNDGTGRFTEVTSQVLGDFRTYGWKIWAIADFNGDGYDDLFLSDAGVDWEPCVGAGNHLLMGQADGTLIDEGALRVPAPREVAAYGDWGDIDGDDDVDILICGTGGWYNLLINDGNGYFAYDDFRMPPPGLGPPDFRSSNARLIDIDRDGDLDAFFGTGAFYSDRDVILLNDGDGYFQVAPAGALPPRAAGSSASLQNEEGDINGDGWPDILVWTDAGLQLLVNNGDGTYRDGTSLLWQPANTGLHGINIIGDLNGDGWQDMILSHGELRYHINHGGNSFEDITDAVFPAMPITNEGYNTLADVDNDGDLDILGTFDVPHGIYVLVNVLPYAVPEPPLPLPEAPFLMSPANGVTIPTIDAPLGWTAVTGALAYRLQVALDPSFSQIVRDRRDLTFNAFPLRGLSGNSTYFWRVRALNARGDSPWTEAWSFTTPYTVTVSGTVTFQGSPFGGARMLDLPGQPVTDLNGHYETQVEIGWSGTARPYRAQYNFVPETTAYVNVVSERTTDYVAYIGIPQHERQALIAFYDSTGGDNWIDRTGWKEPPLEADGFAAYGSEGSWFGVAVDIMDPPYMYPVTVIGLNGWDNNVDGVLPANIGDLTNMVDFRIQGALRGTLPASMASFTKLRWFIINNTDLQGNIPAWLGNNPDLMNLQFRLNRMSGTIPPELGNCVNLALLYIDGNMFVGPIPAEFMSLASLSEGSIGNNALFAEPAVQAFVESHLGAMGPQTLAPTDVTAEARSGSSILVSWTWAGGFPSYNVSYSTTPGGPYTYSGSAEWWESSLTVDGLSPGTTYYFVVQSCSDPHEANKNTVVSAYSAEASATTPIGPVTAKVDLNGDGQEDILWRYYGGGAYQGLNLAWLMGQTGTAAPMTLTAAASEAGARSSIYDETLIPASQIVQRVEIPRSSDGSPKDPFKTVLLEEKARVPKTRMNSKNPMDLAGDLSKKVRGRGIGREIAGFLGVEDAPLPGATDSGEVDLSSLALGTEVVISVLPDTTWEIAGTADFNGDGKTDILWRNYGTGAFQGMNDIWFMNGTTFVSETIFSIVADTSWRIAGTGDFNGDGKTDILWRNHGSGAVQGMNVIWFMDNGVFQSETVFSQIPDTSWRIAGTGDFNGDGKTDILWRYHGAGAYQGMNVVWFMDGPAFQSESVFSIISDTAWEIAGTGDFDSDGKTDILWRYYGVGAYQGMNDIWYLNGTAFLKEEIFSVIPDTNWRIVNR